MKKIIRYVSCFFATLLLCMTMLVVASFAPQDAIDKNVAESAKAMLEEPLYPRLVDKTYGSRLDNFTDAQILMQSKAMSSRQLDSVLTNPRFVYENKNPVESLYEYTNDDDPEPAMYYTRYWMGFRAVVRWLLTFLNYYQIKRYLLFLLFALFALAMCSVANHLGTKQAVAFALSVLLIRPYVVGQSLQFSTCFLLAFTGMVFAPYIQRNPKYEGLFFMELGMVTMFFDFYTTPVITFALPMIYLYLLRMHEGAENEPKRIVKNALIWFLAYLVMWIAKMALTEIFTSAQGWYSGFLSVCIWFGIGEYRKETGLYSPHEAFVKLLQCVTSDDDGVVLIQIALVLLAVWLIACFVRKRINKENCRRGLGMVLIGALPLVWFVITSEPTRIHFWFQYRSLVATYWAVGAYLCAITETSVDGNTKTRQNN